MASTTADDSKKPTVGSSTDRPKKRINKPLIEKRRRERINECLNQLQTMITQLDKDKSKRTRGSKLEKADILEMTVEFIKNGQIYTKDKVENSERDDNTKQYMEGYKKCVDEINTFLSKTENVSSELKTSILSHVNKTLDPDSSSNGQCVNKKPDEKAVISYSNCPAIKPKILPSASSGGNTSQISNLLTQTASGLAIQKPCTTQTVPSITQTAPSNVNPVAVVCNREIPTYVLVPTATLCQSVQFSVGSQSGLNGTNPVALINNNAFNSGSYINTVNNDVNTNFPQMLGSGQIVVVPPSQTVIQQQNGVMGNFQPNLRLSDSSLNVNSILNRSVVANLQQPQAQESDSDVWRPW